MTLAKWTDDPGDFADYWPIVPGDLQTPRVGQGLCKSAEQRICKSTVSIVMTLYRVNTYPLSPSHRR